MIHLIISKQALEQEQKSELALSARIDHIKTDHEEMLSDIPADIKKFHLNVPLPRSRYNQIMNSRESDCLIILKFLIYPDDFIVSKESVKSVGDLTKERTRTLWDLFSGDTREEIAEKSFKAKNTVNRHSYDVFRELKVTNRCEAIGALFRFWLEYWQN